jgi:hypothetical protein
VVDPRPEPKRAPEPQPEPVSSKTVPASGTKPKHARGKAKQSSKFNPDWKKGRPWLKYEPGLGMTCLLCQKYKKLPFNRTTWNTTPCTRLRQVSITEHEATDSHTDAQKRDQETRVLQDIREAADPEVSASAMEKAFASLYFLVKRRVAHSTNYEPLLDLLTFLGLDVKDQIRVAKNATYTSHKSIQEMLYILSEVIENDMLNELKDSEHFAIMFDESSDCTNIEQLVIHARYISANGELQVKFLKILDALQPEIEAIANAARNEGSADADPSEAGTISVNAQVITRRVTEYIEGASLEIMKMRGVGTDGASVMTGSKNGVVKKLKDKVPTLIGVHCTAHRLNLASSQAAKNVTDVKQFDDVLRQLYDFFDNSNVRTAGFLVVQKILFAEKDLVAEGARGGLPGKLLAPSTTRWLSIGHSVERIRKAFPDLIVALQREGTERTDAKAIGLCRLVTTYKFAATMLLLCDILPHINTLSKIFQKQQSDYTIVRDVVSATISSLKTYKETDGDNLKRLPEYLEMVKTGLSEADISLLHKKTDETHFNKNIRAKYIDRLVENLEDRFDETDMQGMSLLLTLFRPADVVALSPQELAEYGTDKVTAIHTFYHGSNVLTSLEELQREWLSLKHYIVRVTTETKQNMSDTEFVQRLCTRQTLCDVYPNMSKLAMILRVLPSNTADPERTFSQMKLIKTNIRNRMVEQTLDAILRIVIEGPPIERFPFKTAVRIWARKKNRRITHS